MSISLSLEELMMPQKGKKTRRARRKLTSLPENLRSINLDAAGIDIGSEEHWVAVPEGRDERSVLRFGAFTEDLERLVDWLEKCEVTTVAMESTGVYWIPLYEVLERRGFEVHLVDARHVKNVPGRKTDVLDCQWLQQLHTFGLLKGAFRPADEISVLRSYVRQKEMLTQAASMHIQHMQKALQQMNVLLHNVVSDITGLTGMRIIKAIVAGERDSKKLASYRHENCHNTEETIAKSLKGNYREEHVFALKQAVELYDFYEGKIDECDTAIVGVLGRQPDVTDEELPPDGKNVRSRDRVRSGLDLRDKLFKMCGVDLFNVPGLAAEVLLVLASEVGFDMSPWRTEKALHVVA